MFTPSSSNNSLHRMVSCSNLSPPVVVPSDQHPPLQRIEPLSVTSRMVSVDMNLATAAALLSSAPTTTSSSAGGIEPSPYDVLAGKDKSFNKHFGNRLFKTVIASNLDQYRDNLARKCSKSDKMKLTKKIIKEFRTLYPNSRFIKLGTDGRTWEEISDNAARDKVSHALRFAAKYEAAKKQPKAASIFRKRQRPTMPRIVSDTTIVEEPQQQQQQQQQCSNSVPSSPLSSTANAIFALLTAPCKSLGSELLHSHGPATIAADDESFSYLETAFANWDADAEEFGNMMLTEDQLEQITVPTSLEDALRGEDMDFFTGGAFL